MPFIQNVSFDDIQKGRHIEPGPNSVLIQIVDPILDFPVPLKEFTFVHRFKFSDNDNVPMQHAHKLVEILKEALENRRNVVVHCVAGLCRSGAVKEVGVAMGFQDSESFTIPNVVLKSYMMSKLREENWEIPDAGENIPPDF